MLKHNLRFRRHAVRALRGAFAMATNVHDLCVQQDITLEQLAERSGLELTRIQAIYLGRWTPSPVERQKSADVFGLEIDEVTWGHKTPIQHIYGHGPG